MDTSEEQGGRSVQEATPVGGLACIVRDHRLTGAETLEPVFMPTTDSGGEQAEAGDQHEPGSHRLVRIYRGPVAR